MPHNPERLHVVQRADALVVEIHAFAARHRRTLSDLSPGMRSQLVRAGSSIALNLSEACGYQSNERSISFLEIAIGSCNEVERVVRLCQRLGLNDRIVPHILEEIAGVRMMTYGLRKHMLRRP